MMTSEESDSLSNIPSDGHPEDASGLCTWVQSSATASQFTISIFYVYIKNQLKYM